MTVTANTAHGGTHLWYRMPAGKRYGNQRGTLPKWLDIRGFGGYVVAPPSVLVEAPNGGGAGHGAAELPYTFAAGRKPTDLDPAPLPAALVTILDAAQAGVATAVHFTDDSDDKPDLARWDLSADIIELIANGAPRGSAAKPITG